MALKIDKARLDAARDKAVRTLLDARRPEGHWEGRLSSSALSTATSLGALAFVARQSSSPDPRIQDRVEAGLKWLADNVNEDGGWGDTDLSLSNISTTTLCWAAFAMADADQRYPEIVEGAEAWLTSAAGGIKPENLAPAIIRRYGKDKTFSVPILTMCVISGRMGTGRDAWKWVKQLPFELAAFPHRFFAALRLPVVSYALPALIAIGNARHARRPTWNPLTRWFRNRVRDKTLEKLKSIQPESGGFLEASPLTSFVAMSLAAAGQVGHAVTNKCVEFLVGNAREDGSWPIDTNLATWVTTLSINGLAIDPTFEFKDDEFDRVREWLLHQQYKDLHPYTNAAPGGWAWTDLSGGVPDADDTAGALLALSRLGDPCPVTRHVSNKLAASSAKHGDAEEAPHMRQNYILDSFIEFYESVETEEQRTYRRHCLNGSGWLRSLQNGDGGIPTFCRGWTNLPFDRSSPDITAHTLRAWDAIGFNAPGPGGLLDRSCEKARTRGLAYLQRNQQPDGSWIPLWFGNQHDNAEENRTYGTAKVLLAAAGDLGNRVMDYKLMEEPYSPDEKSFVKFRENLQAEARKGVDQWVAKFGRGIKWLLDAQQDSGGWSGGRTGPPSVEETALAIEALAEFALVDEEIWNGFNAEDVSRAVEKGAHWLIEKIESDEWTRPSPIGFYFAKLWYYEELYPIIFSVAALNKIEFVLARIEMERGLGWRAD